ncbi:MAG: hypothetical protein IIT46_00575 [Lachnospiraceae bacterium]|nr:hypothetical protein [Lachnospiraceae bacterium]
MTEQNYRLIREAMNDCYNVFYTKWAKKSLLGKLTAEDWLIIVDEAKTVAEKYSDTSIGACCVCQQQPSFFLQKKSVLVDRQLNLLN